jgi:hypothetical protein
VTDRRARFALGVLVAASIATACRRAPPATVTATAPPPASSATLSLPKIGGFDAGPQIDGTEYVRRRYSRGAVRIEVTLARMPMSPEAYAEWVRMSTASFPQATLELPATDGNGFYQCSDGATPSCDLLIQLRAGFHLEIRGGGTSTRDDVDAIARALPLRMLTGS